MGKIWILPIYKGPFICYETLPKTATHLHLDEKLFPKEFT